MPVKHLKALSLATVAVFALSGCGWLQEDVSSGSSYNRWESAAATTPAPPATRVMQTAEGTWLEPDKIAKPVATATELAELKQANTRIAQLETEISSLRNDMNMMMPALTKLAGGQSVTAEALNDIQTAAGGSIAAGEVTRIHRNYEQANTAFSDNPEIEMDAPINAPAAARPQALQNNPTYIPQAPMVMAPSAPQQPQPMVQIAPMRAQPAAYTPPSVNITSIRGVRFGHHEGGKSRMVIDVSAAPAFTFDIDNNERILMVEIPGTVWNAGPVTKMIQDNPLVQSMAASPDGQGGTRVVFQLKAPAKVVWSQAIPPSGAQGHRIVFDVAAN